MIHQALLIAVALAYSAAMLAVGRRLSRPASIAAYTTAVAVLFSVPLFPEQTVQRVDHVLHLAGAGRLLVHGAFMIAITGLFLTVVLATHQTYLAQALRRRTLTLQSGRLVKDEG